MDTKHHTTVGKFLRVEFFPLDKQMTGWGGYKWYMLSGKRSDYQTIVN